MATLIPAIGSCASRMTGGEKRLAERLEQKLEDDYLLWYDVPIGPKHLHPDFVVMHPRRGMLKTLPNPAEQARQHAHAVVDALKRDPQLVRADGKHQGGLTFPWSYGVVFPNMTRKQFTDGQLDQIIEPNQVICSDEMLEKVDPEDLQSRMWGMFPFMMRGAMSLPQLDRVRWILFPEVRVQTSGVLFDDGDADAELPDIMRVMDLQQEQLARSLGDGHRVIHGMAGSGKTMILGYRAEYLAKGLADTVHVRHFHKWCRDQLKAACCCFTTTPKAFTSENAASNPASRAWACRRRGAPPSELTPRSWTNFKGSHGEVRDRVQAQSG
jgi:hypothetical protein